VAKTERKQEEKKNYETAAVFFCQQFPFTGNTPTTANSTKRRRRELYGNESDHVECSNAWIHWGKVEHRDNNKPQPMTHRSQITAHVCLGVSLSPSHSRRCFSNFSAISSVDDFLTVLNFDIFAFFSSVCASSRRVQVFNFAPFTGR
jgi:hypothetical protein